MPEVMIIYRFYYEENGMTDAWWDAFLSLSPEKMKIIKPIIHENDFSNIHSMTSDKDILNVLEFYTITRNDAETAIKVSDRTVT